MFQMPVTKHRQLRIVIVEDEAIIALALKQALTSLGHDVCAMATNAKGAIEAVEQHRPDVVLMDIMLQGEEDGISAAQTIWFRFRIRSLFMSAFDTASIRLRAVTAQPFGFLAKPYRLEELRCTLENLPINRVTC